MPPQTENSASVPPGSSSVDHGRRKLWIIIILLLPLALGSSYGVYSWQHKKVSELSSQTKSSPAGSSKTQSYVTSIGVSYPLSLPKKKVLITLYLPSGNNVLQTDPHLTSQDTLAANYTESFNDLMASWEFSDSGAASNPSTSGPGNGNNGITISALNDWMSKNDPSTVSYDPVTGAMTTSQKSDFVTNLKKQTTSCSSDASKGFTTSDKIFNICYTFQSPKAKDADWAMNLSGYAEIGGTLTYLRGFINNLPPSTYQTLANNYIQALKNTSTVVQAN